MPSSVPRSARRGPARRWRRVLGATLLGCVLVGPVAAHAETSPLARPAVPEIDLDRADLATLQAQSVVLQSQFVKASLAYEQAQRTAAQAREAAEAKQAAAEAKRAEVVRARDVFAQFVVAQYQDSVMSSPTVRSMVASNGDVDDLLTVNAVATQVVVNEAEQIYRLEVLMGEAETLAEEAAAARAVAEEHEAEAADILDEIRERAAQVAAAASKALMAAADQAAFADAEQQARNRAALAAWEAYLDRVAAAKVFPYPAKDLADPKRLPDGLRPLIGADGKPVPGVARVMFRKEPLVVLPTETVATVSRAFAQIGKPYVVGKRGPESYDCAGLSAAMWDRSGYRLPGTVAGQWKTTRSVPVADAQVGDAVFFAAAGAGIHHTGIYLGGGFMLTADGVSNQVGVQEVSDDVYGATRVTLRSGPARKSVPSSDGSMLCGASTVQSSAAVPGGMVLPVAEGSFTFTGHWGQPGSLWSSGYHTGLDLAAPVGTPVFAAAAGRVTVTDAEGWAGPNFVMVDHGNGLETWYAHMSSATVKTGQMVRAGQQIGQVGSEGNSTGPHLHFEVRIGGVDVDPYPFLTGQAAPTAGSPGAAGWGGFTNGMISAAAMCGLATAPGHQLECRAAHAYDALSAAYAKVFGEPITITDSYRSYAAQVTLYGQKPTLAAIPGTSIHGWAKAVDLGGGIEVFGSREHEWMVRNAPKFGWVHPAWARQGGGREEPWHWEFGVLS